MECCYCKKILKTSYSLKTHQKTAKYCLKLRGKLDKGEFVCECCEKTFFKKGHLQDHMNICEANTDYVNKLKHEIVYLKNTIKEIQHDLNTTVQTYEDKVQTLEKEKDKIMKDLLKHSETIAKQPRYTQNNRINITQNLAVFNKTESDIQRLVSEGFNKEHLVHGQKGAARFTNEKIINNDPSGRPVYVITDKTRGHGKYKVSPNETVVDTGMVGLSEKVMPCVRRKAALIYSEDFNNEAIQEGYNDLVHEDISKFRNEIIKLQSLGTGSGVDLGTGSGVDLGTGSGVDLGTGSGVDLEVDSIPNMILV